MKNKISTDGKGKPDESAVKPKLAENLAVKTVAAGAPQVEHKGKFPHSVSKSAKMMRKRMVAALFTVSPQMMGHRSRGHCIRMRRAR